MSDWIRCEDRLPEDLDEDLVWVTGTYDTPTADGLVTERYISFGCYSSPTLWWDLMREDIFGEPMRLYNPTHWMPFVKPEFPEEAPVDQTTE